MNHSSKDTHQEPNHKAPVKFPHGYSENQSQRFAWYNEAIVNSGPGAGPVPT